MKTTILSVLALASVGFVAAEDHSILLDIEVTKEVSCTKMTQLGDMLRVNYNGTFTNGTLFDSSKTHHRGKPEAVCSPMSADCCKGFDQEKGGWSPISFQIGKGQLIKGCVITAMKFPDRLRS